MKTISEIRFDNLNDLTDEQLKAFALLIGLRV
jgi:hypothetical protein